MGDDINVEITDETLDISFDTIGVIDHANYHEAGGRDEIDLGGLSASGDINLKGNELDNTFRIRSHGGSNAHLFTEGATWNVYDSTNSQYISRFHEGGNVKIPNGDLLGGGKLVDFSHLSFGASGGQIRFNRGANGQDVEFYDDSAALSTLFVRSGGNVEVPNGGLTAHGITLPTGDIHAGSSYPKLRTQGDTGGNGWVIYDEYNNQNILIGKEGGDVDVPNGNLRLNDNFLFGVRDIKTSYPNFKVRTDGNGSSYVSLWDEANSQTTLTAHEGGKVEVPNGPVSLIGPDATSSDVKTESQRLKLTGSYWDSGTSSSVKKTAQVYYEPTDANTSTLSLKTPDGAIFYTPDSAGGGKQTIDYSGPNRVEVHSSGSLMQAFSGVGGSQGHTIVAGYNSGSAVELHDGYNNQDILVAKNGGNVDIPNGNLDINGNNLDNPHLLNFIDFTGDGTWFQLGEDASGSLKFKRYNSTGFLGESMVFSSGGNVEVPSGGLRVKGTHGGGDALAIAGDLKFTDTTSYIQSGGSGSDAVILYDSANGQNLIEAHEGGNVDIPNGKLYAPKIGSSNTYGNPTSLRDFVIDFSGVLEEDNLSAVTNSIVYALQRGGSVTQTTGPLPNSSHDNWSVLFNNTVDWSRMQWDNIDNQTVTFELTLPRDDYFMRHFWMRFQGGTADYVKIEGYDPDNASWFTFYENTSNSRQTIKETARSQNFGSQTKVSKLRISVDNRGANAGDNIGISEIASTDERTQYGQAFVDRSGGNILGDVNLSNNWLTEIGTLKSSGGYLDIKTNGTGGASVRVQDTANAQSVLVANEGGKVEVPNGPLVVGSNNSIKASIDDADLLTSGTGTGSWSVWDDANSNKLITANEGGNIEIPNGNLNLGGNNIDNIKDINSLGYIRAGRGDMRFESQGSDGTGTIDLYDAYNGKYILRANEGGQVKIPSGKTIIAGDSYGDALYVSGGEAVFEADIRSADGGRIKNKSDTQNAREMKSHVGVTDTGKAQLLSVASDTGKVLVVNRTNGASAEFYVDGVNNAVTEVSDPSGAFSTTEGNAGTTNIYWDATNARFEVNNETGASADYSVHLLA